MLKNKKMKYNFINSWESEVKQDDKVCLKLRLGKLTIIEISSDFSDNYLRFIFLNLGFEVTE
jgi:hypothetical protein